MTITKKNNKYYCRFQLNGERHHYLCGGATTVKEAQSIENAFKYKLQQQQNGIIPRNPKKVALSLLVELYIEYNKNNNKQKEPKEKVKSFYEFFGKDINVNNIQVKDIEKFRTWLCDEKQLSNSTINRYISCLSKTFNLGIDNGVITVNPCSKLKMLKEPKETIKFYTTEEETKLFEGLKKYRPDFIPFVTCAFSTGLRLENLRLLKWTQVDMENRIIQIQPQDNKGHKVIRLFITKRLYDNMPDKVNDYVFINPESGGVYINPNRILKKVCDKVGIKHIGFHGIRHTVGTRLIKQGTPINVVQAVLAHSDIRTTMKYVHLTDNSIKDALSVLDSYN